MLGSTVAMVGALILILFLVLLLFLFVAVKYIQHRKDKRNRRKPQPLLPITNVGMAVNDHDRKSIFGGVSPASSTTSFCVPEIRLTFPDEDVLPCTPGVPGQRLSRVVILQLGEAGAAYVTSPPPYEVAMGGESGKVEEMREKS
jgi:hypothetical protein